MKCPKCGGYIPDGHLYCDNCGEEISFVPDFDPEVENRINESLSGVANNLKEDIFHTQNLFGDDDNKSGFSFYRNHITTILGAVIIILAAVLISFSLISKLHDSRSTEEMAQEYYVDGKLDKAIELLEKALSETDPADSEKVSDLIIKLYDYKKEAGYTEDAVQTLSKLVDEYTFSPATVELAVDELISYYDNRKEYDTVIEILSGISSDEIKNKYSYYYAEVPSIQPEEGEYDKIIEIVITDNSDGDIYYTVNGDTPDENSIKYAEPLVIETEGDYVIKAVCINKYGIVSDVATSIFTLENVGPAAPEVMEESGDYSQSTMIVAVCESGCTIYYTTDGSDPTTNSKVYSTPISMPLGTTTFKFVAADAEGNLSDIVEREYHLSYTKMVSVEQARESIIKILLKLDILLDANGKMRGEEGYFDYVYDGDIEITGSGDYYVFVETHVYNDGTSSETGLLYAVNSHDGKVNRLGYDSSGNYTLITISNR